MSDSNSLTLKEYIKNNVVLIEPQTLSKLQELFSILSTKNIVTNLFGNNDLLGYFTKDSIKIIDKVAKIFSFNDEIKFCTLNEIKDTKNVITDENIISQYTTLKLYDDNILKLFEYPITSSGFHKPVFVTKEMAELINIDVNTYMSPIDIGKKIYKYISDNNLYDKNDRRNIILNDKLRSIFLVDNSEILTYFKLQFYINKHFIKMNEEQSRECAKQTYIKKWELL